MVLFNHDNLNTGLLYAFFSLCDTSLSLGEDAKAILKNLPFLNTAVKPNIHLAMLIARESTPCPFLFASDELRPAFSTALNEAGKRWARGKGLMQTAVRGGGQHDQALLDAAERQEVGGGDRRGADERSLREEGDRGPHAAVHGGLGRCRGVRRREWRIWRAWR